MMRGMSWEAYHKVYPAGWEHLLIHHECYAVLQEILDAYVYTYLQSKHSCFSSFCLRVPLSHNFHVPCLSHTLCLFLLVHCLSTSALLLLPTCFPHKHFLHHCLSMFDADGSPSWHFVYLCPPMRTYGCQIVASFYAHVYLVIWSLGVSTQDWAVEPVLL